MENTLDTYKLIVLTRDILRKIRDIELENLGVSSAHAAIMLAIEELGGIATSAQISKLLIREPHSTHETIIRIEKLGLVDRFLTYKGKKRVKVALTDKGRESLALIKERKSIKKLMDSFPPEQNEQLNKLLKTFFDLASKEYSQLSEPQK